jgi:phosphate transport system protein
MMRERDLEGHIVRTFDGDILNLRMRALEMGGLAMDQVQRAVGALLQGDADQAHAVIVRTESVAACLQAIDEEIIQLIARRQPVAYDLRAILTIGRVANDLERVGAAGRKIARLALELNDAAVTPVAYFRNDIRKLAAVALAMLRAALDCFDRVDLDGAEAVRRRDRDLDAEFQLALRALVTYVMEDPRLLASTIQTVFVMKALERVGDHARNIAAVVPRLARREDAASEMPVAATPAAARVESR